MIQPLDRVGFFVILSMLSQKPMHKVNRFNGLFGNIEANSLQICHAQLRLMENDS